MEINPVTGVFFLRSIEQNRYVTAKAIVMSVQSKKGGRSWREEEV